MRLKKVLVRLIIRNLEHSEFSMRKGLFYHISVKTAYIIKNLKAFE